MIRSSQKLTAKKGFTLIELLVVIAVIGILASVILVGVASFRGKGRDARRISDIRQIQNALELYFTSNAVYPGTLTILEDAGSSIGVNQWPRDPSTNAKYSYCLDSGRYTLGATLEQQNAAIKDVVRTNLLADGFKCDPIDPVVTCASADTDKGYCVTI